MAPDSTSPDPGTASSGPPQVSRCTVERPRQASRLPCPFRRTQPQRSARRRAAPSRSPRTASGVVPNRRAASPSWGVSTTSSRRRQLAP